MQRCNHDELFARVDSWINLPTDKRSRLQQMAIDVLYAIVAIQGDGLHHFWHTMGSDAPRIIESFRMAGLAELADGLAETSFCSEVIQRGVDDDGHWQFTDSQDKTLSRVERTLFREVEIVHDKIFQLLATAAD